MEVELKKRDDESRTQYIFRLATMKDRGELDMTWDELAKVLNEELGLSYGSSAYRKPYTQAMTFYNEVFANQNESEAAKELREARQELYKERTRLRDERNQLNRQLREEARKEAFLEEVKNTLAEQIPIKVEKKQDTGNQDVDAIVCLSDMHVGVTANNAQNEYNTDVMLERLSDYLDEIGIIQNRHHAHTCHLCLLGDQISGSIHASITATNSVNTVQQIKLACTAISQFVEGLAEIFYRVNIYSVSGNHSRVNSNKDDNIPGDNLDSLIAFYLEAALGSNPRVKIFNTSDVANFYDYSRLFYTDAGRIVVAVHGDLDSPNNVVSNMTQLYGETPDIVLMGHMHHSAMNTVGKTRVIQCGCLCGTDGYAFNKRLFAPVEQTVIITSGRKTVECIYNVSLEDENVYPFEE